MTSTSAPLPAEPKHRGTLACVVLKAKNLPNKRAIGKQDPFAVLTIGTDKQKTKPDKRGGQHPNWDEQLHFEIYDDVEDVLNAASKASSDAAGGSSGSSKDSTLSAASASGAKASSAKKGAGGKKMLKVACYADDNREPELIGEGMVDLTGVLKTGEFDEWVTIRHKDRYCGEVYLELTFFSSAPRPRRVKKTKQQLDTAAGTYGGAGTFTSEVDDADFAPPPPPGKPATVGRYQPAIPASLLPMGRHPRLSSSASTPLGSSLAPSRVVSGVPSTGGSAPPIDEIPSALRPSSSLAGLAAYTPPYAPSTIHRTSSPQPPVMTSSMTMPGFDERKRTDSFPGSSASRPDLYSMYAASVRAPSQPPMGAGDQGSLRHSHSQSFSNLPSSFSTNSSIASMSTLRPASTQPPPAPADPMQDLIRPMSSMSVSNFNHAPPVARPLPALLTSPYQQTQPAGVQAQPQPQGAGPVYAQAPYGQAYPQQTNPTARTASQSYTLLPPANSHSAAPTPPPQPNSAPPQIHPAQTFVPANSAGSSVGGQPQQAVYEPPRSTSPQPPPRPLSTAGYHALPPLPGAGGGNGYTPSNGTVSPAPTLYQQQQPQTQYVYGDAGPGGAPMYQQTSSPANGGARPLPPTTPQPQQGAAAGIAPSTSPAPYYTQQVPQQAGVFYYNPAAPGTQPGYPTNAPPQGYAAQPVQPQQTQQPVYLLQSPYEVHSGQHQPPPQQQYDPYQQQPHQVQMDQQPQVQQGYGAVHAQALGQAPGQDPYGRQPSYGGGAY